MGQNFSDIFAVITMPNFGPLMLNLEIFLLSTKKMIVSWLCITALELTLYLNSWQAKKKLDTL